MSPSSDKPPSGKARSEERQASGDEGSEWEECQEDSPLRQILESLAEDEGVSGTLLRESRLFQRLDDAGRERMLKGGVARTFSPGYAIIREGEMGMSFFVIEEGEVRVTTNSPSGEEVELAVLGPGAFFGEVAVLSGRPRTATVRALTEVRAVQFSKELADEILQDYPELRELFETTVKGRAEDTIGKLSR